MKLFESLSSDSWILCETRFVVESLRRNAGLEPTVLTTADAAVRLLRELRPEQSVRRLHHPARRTALWRLITEQSQFPLLRQELSSAIHGIPKEIDRLLRFLDSVRLHQTEDQLIRSAIDEHGNVILDRREELISLIAAYQEVQSFVGAYDGPAVLEQLLVALNRVETIDVDTILLFRPMQVFPLEQSVYDRLSHLCEFRVSVDAVVCQNEYRDHTRNSDTKTTETANRSSSSTAVQTSLFEAEPARGSQKVDQSTASDSVQFPKPSEAYLQSLRYFLSTSSAKIAAVEQHPSTVPDRALLVDQLIDSKLLGETELGASLDGVAIWRSAERRDEARRLAEAIAAARTAGRAQPAEYHILAFDVEPYRSLMEAEFDRLNIPLQITKGTALAGTLPADFLRKLISWLQEQNLASAEALFSHPFAASPKLATASTKRFLKRHREVVHPILEHPQLQKQRGNRSVEDFLVAQVAGVRPLFSCIEQGIVALELLPSEESAGSEHLLQQLVGRLRYCCDSPRSYQETRGGRELRDSVRREVELLLSGIASLAIFEQEAEYAAKLQSANETAPQYAAAIRQYYNRIRLRLSTLRSSSSNPQAPLQQLVRATRQVQQVFRYAAADFERVSLARFVSHLLEYVDRIQLQVDFQPDAVRLTEFLDGRTIFSPAVVLLGCSARELNAWIQGGSAPENGELDVVTNQLNRRGRAVSRVQESHWLLAQLCRNAKELVFSVPDRDEQNEVLPMTFLTDLASLFPDQLARNELRLLADADSEVIATDGSLAPVEPCPRALALLRGRLSPHFTEYDGQLGPESSMRLCRIRAKNAGLEQQEGALSLRLSVSSLELLSENPLQFLFQELLGLQPRSSGFESEIPLYVGTIVHRCLERFFDPGQGFSPESLQGDLEQACKRMIAIAMAAFADHPLDWDSHPLLRSRKNWLLAGLQSNKRPSAVQGRQGPLFAALIYQRDFLQTVPERVEYRFGLSEDAPALLVQPEADIGLSLEVTGCIDRIDRHIVVDQGSGTPLAIWDYKTGGAATLRDIDSQKSLQLPLYAAALRQCFETLPARGGIIDLSQPNRSDLDMPSPRKGVCRELLALEARGSSFSSEAVERRVEQTLAHVRSLLWMLAEGSFLQPLEADIDRYSQHAALHCRDEVLLEKKWKSREEATGEEATSEEATSKEPLAEIRAGSLVPRDFLQNQHSSRELRLSAEQQAACRLEQPICLSAGAGSGKTAVLRARVLELIHRGESIESLLAVTFTEKAAEEIRQRVEQALSGVLASNSYRGSVLSDVERGRFTQAKAAVSQAQISTIHGLATRIVAMDLRLSGLEHFNRILTSSEQQTQLGAAVRAVVRSEDGRETAERVLDFGVHARTLQQQLARLALSPQLLDDLNEVLDESKRSYLTELVSEYQKRKRGELQQEHAAYFALWLQDLAEWLAGKGGEMPADQLAAHRYLEAEVEKLLKADDTDWLSQIASLRLYIQENQGFAKRKSKHTPRNFMNDVRDTLGTLQEQRAVFTLSDVAERQAWQLVQGVAQLAAMVRQRYQRLKAGKQLVDFDDLISGAHRMLCQEVEPRYRARQAAVCQRLQQQFHHIMVDEFQDTDRQQWELLSKIAGLCGTELAADTLFLVGDAQQSIYGFRGGDSRVFDLAREQLERVGGISLSLDDNYRSQPEIVDFVNDLFEKLFAVDFATDEACKVPKALSPTALRAQQMHAKTPVNTAGEPKVQQLWKPYEKGAGRQENSDTGEAKFLAAHLKQLLSSFETDGRSSQYPELSLHSGSPQIAVLTRTVRQLSRVANALEAEKLEFSISHSSGFYELAEIAQLEHVLRLLVHPDDAIALVGVLRSPLMGLSDRHIVDLYAELNGAWITLEGEHTSPSELLSFVQGRLADWQRLSRMVPCSNLLEHIARTSGLREAYVAVGKGEAFGNIERFIDRLASAERKNECGVNPQDALNWLINERVAGSDAPTANSVSHPIVLSTIHGSKGLEYPMVVLPFLAGRQRREHDFIKSEIPDGSGRSMLGVRIEDPTDDYRRKKTLTMQLLEENQQAMYYSEERRVFYVACTRAKHYLLLSLREGGKFEAEQKELAELSDSAKAERCRTSDAPAFWLRALGIR